MRKGWTHLLLPMLLMVLFAITRWPGLLPENFSAAYALAFCAGVFFPRTLAWTAPLLTLLVSDVIMNLVYYHVDAVDRYMLVNYGAYAVLIGLGRLFSPRSAWWKLVLGGLLGACIFYLVTNTAAWIENPAYPKTLAGWFQALTTGIPGYPPTWMFFKNTLLSGGLFTGLFAGAVKAEEARVESEEESEEEETEGEPEEA